MVFCIYIMSLAGGWWGEAGRRSRQLCTTAILKKKKPCEFHTVKLEL